MVRRHSQWTPSDWSPFESDARCDQPVRPVTRQFPNKDQVGGPFALGYGEAQAQDNVHAAQQLKDDPNSDGSTIDDVCRALANQISSPQAAVTRLLASFSKYDTQRQGALAANDFCAALRHMGVQLDAKQLKSLQSSFSSNGSKCFEAQTSLDYNAFVSALQNKLHGFPQEAVSNSNCSQSRQHRGGRVHYGAHSPAVTSQLHLGPGDDNAPHPALSEHPAFSSAAGLPQTAIDRKFVAVDERRVMDGRQGVKAGYYQSASRPVPYGLGGDTHIERADREFKSMSIAAGVRSELAIEAAGANNFAVGRHSPCRVSRSTASEHWHQGGAAGLTQAEIERLARKPRDRTGIKLGYAQAMHQEIPYALFGTEYEKDTADSKDVCSCSFPAGVPSDLSYLTTKRHTSGPPDCFLETGVAAMAGNPTMREEDAREGVTAQQEQTCVQSSRGSRYMVSAPPYATQLDELPSEGAQGSTPAATPRRAQHLN